VLYLLCVTQHPITYHTKSAAPGNERTRGARVCRGGPHCGAQAEWSSELHTADGRIPRRASILLPQQLFALPFLSFPSQKQQRDSCKASLLVPVFRVHVLHPPRTSHSNLAPPLKKRRRKLTPSVLSDKPPFRSSNIRLYYRSTTHVWYAHHCSQPALSGYTFIAEN
jgi:hypothetical protein